MPTQEQVTLSSEQLKSIIVEAVGAAVREARKPTDIEQKALDLETRLIENAQEARKNLAATVIKERENRRITQRNCIHEHPDGKSHCVYVMESQGPGYILCQLNQCIIRPGKEPVNSRGMAIYDGALFNRLFQKLQTGMGDIIF